MFGLTFRALPVLHGGEYVCFGFDITGPGGGRVVYLSDVKHVPEDVMASILAEPRPDLLVLDALSDIPHFSHLSLGEAEDLSAKVGAKRTRLVGMSCALGPHSTVNEGLFARLGTGADVQLAYDGLLLSIP